jgi:hypothetical protein
MLNRKRRLIPVSPAIGHQSPKIGDNQPPFDWKLNPNVVHREKGTIPFRLDPNDPGLPGDHHTNFNEAPDCEWLNYITPNASRYTPPGTDHTRAQYKEKDNYRCRPIEEIQTHSQALIEQMDWAWSQWNAGNFAKHVGSFAYAEFTRYFHSSVILPRPWWGSQIAVKIG